jgi:hypothetical protein
MRTSLNPAYRQEEIDKNAALRIEMLIHGDTKGVFDE